ncbi:MAG: HAMP domain-containing histidine kinase [Dehalococcoidia bacterium]|nr:HAMP domain-containing histidine kinase [Dehalococcoidia bacterium]
MSLRWRIMGATVLVVVLAVLISVAVGYYAAQSRLGEFVDEIGDDEAVQLARNLSREHTTAGGWGTADRALSEAGYSYGQAPGREGSDDGEEDHVEALHRDPVRDVNIDTDGHVVRDNFFELAPGEPAPDLGGRREAVSDLATNQPVGYVYVDVNREFLSSESHGFLSRLLLITLIGGAVTAGVAILLAGWLSRRITAPVTALTDATQAIAQGDTTRLPVTSSDELGKMSAAFNRMTSALETQRELRRRLVNDVSHELNTPLSVIQLEAKGLSDGLQAPERASDLIIGEVHRLRGLVSDLNSLAETDYGELGLTPEATSVSSLLTAEAERWQPQARAREVELSLQLSDGLPDMSLDRMRMSQALGNLLSNAINASEPGGAVVLGAELEGGDTVAISVVDDGAGIEAADLAHVFDRFYRTDQSRSRGIAGTGLGLAIARAVVEAHGGTVTVSSAGPGQGATVIIRLIRTS